MQVTATEAKNRFGYVCSRAKSEPVFVEKDGRVDSVILSIEEFQAMKVAVPIKSMAQRRAEFNEKNKDWIDAQNAHHEAHGLWCDGMVAWLGDAAVAGGCPVAALADQLVPGGQR